MDFPAGKDELVRAAHAAGARGEVIQGDSVIRDVAALAYDDPPS